jgi:glycosyltransferase involved in cell wall biosynthesis
MSRILVIAHGHPELSLGGGELAALQQCRQLRALGHQVLFVGRQKGLSGRGGTPFTARGEDVLFHSPNYDHFLHSQRAKWSIYKDFRSLIDRFAPDVVHLHHYVHMGLEMIRELRKYAAELPIVLTLHEYLAICHSHGQFVKTSGALCYRSGPADCHGCFEAYTPQEFFLRESFIKSFLDLVDRFVCPSQFLLERYAAWGLPREKLLLLENGQPPAMRAPAADDPAALAPSFAFFGQMSALKGIPVLINALQMLPASLHAGIRVDIHGTMAHQAAAFAEQFTADLVPLRGFVHYHGAYRPDDLPALMQGAGWVIVPSIWWENSPLVIQEAFSHGRPVICSDIGGMAEKVEHGRTGLHFRVGDARSLASTIEQACDPALWQRLAANILPPPSIGQTTQTLLNLYDTIRAGKSPAPPLAAAPDAAPNATASERGRRARRR